MEMKKRTLLMIQALLVAVMVVCAVMVGRKLMDYRKGAEDYSEAAEIAQGGQVSAEPLPEESAYAAMLEEMDLEALQEANGDVVGWIAIPDTEIFYPIMQGDDNAFYLNNTWRKERSSVGAIFLDYRNPSDFSGFHSILYGHQMRNGSMFGRLHKYADENYLREHPVIYLVTDNGVQEYDIFAAYEAGVQDILYRTDVEEDGRQQELVDYVLSHAIADAPTPEADGHILTLSTCTGRGYATRWVVQGVLRAENR